MFKMSAFSVDTGNDDASTHEVIHSKRHHHKQDVISNTWLT